MPLESLKSADRVTGLKQVRKAVESGRAVCVFLADDADRRVTEPMASLCMSRGVAVEHVATMKELGKAASIEVGASAAALLASHH